MCILFHYKFIVKVLYAFVASEYSDYYNLRLCRGYNLNFRAKKGLEKKPSSRPGQVDFPAGLVTFHSHLLDGQGPRQDVWRLNRKKL